MKTTNPAACLAVSAENVADVNERSGGLIITDTAAHAGAFGSILALSATVVAALTSVQPGELLGSASALPIPAGTTIKGNFTSITLTSGKVIAYNQP